MKKKGSISQSASQKKNTRTQLRQSIHMAPNRQDEVCLKLACIIEKQMKIIAELREKILTIREGNEAMRDKMRAIAIFMIFNFTASGQILPRDSATGKIVYHQKIAPAKAKEALYSDIMTWIAFTYVNSNEVVKFADKETGTIAGKGAIAINSDPQYYAFVDYNFVITIRDSACDFTAKNFYFVSDGITMPLEAGFKDQAFNTIAFGWKKTVGKVGAEMPLVISSLNNHLQ